MRGVRGAGGHGGMVVGRCLGMRAPLRLRISLPSRLQAAPARVGLVSGRSSRCVV